MEFDNKKKFEDKKNFFIEFQNYSNPKFLGHLFMFAGEEQRVVKLKK